MTPKLSLASVVVLVITVFTASTPAQVHAQISVVDDTGNTISLASPATRIVSLAPHATELVFAAGGGAKLVGVSAYSDFPAEAKYLPSVGGSGQLDIEAIASLKPDLIIAWASGNHPRQLARLRRLGLTVFESEPRSLEMIASTMERLGTLVGSNQGHLQAASFRRDLYALQQRYADKSPVTVFYQIWSTPLMTLNDTHVISQAIKLCGGVNSFGQLKPLVPTVSREAVVMANPDMLISSDENAEMPTHWQRYKHIKFVKNADFYRIDGSVMNRAGPRIVGATATLCEKIDQVRAKKSGLK